MNMYVIVYSFVRTYHAKGEVVIYARQDTKFFEILLLENYYKEMVFEIVAIEIKKHGVNIVIVGIYPPPRRGKHSWISVPAH